MEKAELSKISAMVFNVECEVDQVLMGVALLSNLLEVLQGEEKEVGSVDQS